MMRSVWAIVADFRAAEWLSLAAAPTFAVMAGLTGMTDGGAQSMSCSMHVSALSGMAPMYALMSGFHCSPWLKLLAHWRGGMRAA